MQGDRIGLWLRHFADERVELQPAARMREILDYNRFAGEIGDAGGVLSVRIASFAPVPLDERLRTVLRSHDLEDSLALGLYSMRFGRPLLDRFERSGDSAILARLARATEIVLDECERFTFPPKTMAFNDHAVAERTEFLMLFLSKLNELGAMPELRVRLTRHITHNAELLADDSRFTWQSNHGLMQIRALLHLAEGAPSSAVGRRSLATAVTRIEETLPYLVADDGAVLEAASGYWLFIYKELAYIGTRRVLPAALRNNIAARLARTAGFLAATVNCRAFLQGMGDSYSRTLTGSDARFAGTYSGIFYYSNALAGFEYRYGGSCAQVLFVSLDTPPPIHKMPEDLALYIFAGEPFFINPGTYAYDDSPERRYVLAPESQSTVTWTAGGNAAASRLAVPRYAQGAWVFEGEKRAAGRTITREVHFDPKSGHLSVIDRAQGEVTSRFNVHPEIRIRLVSDSEILLQGHEAMLRLRHNGRSTLRERWVATADFKKTPIQQIEISGNPVRVEVELPAAGALPQHAQGQAIAYPQRAEIAHVLAAKYPASNLARTESPARFAKIESAAALGVLLVAILVVAGIAPVTSWSLLVLAAAYLGVDAVSEGFVTTWLLTLVHQLRT